MSTPNKVVLWQAILNLEAELARLAGGGSGAAKQYAFVYRPGGVAGDNVYTTWPTLMAAVAAVQGPKVVQLDGTAGALTVPAGAWNIQDVTFVSRDQASQVLTFLAGATVTGTRFSLDSVSFEGTTTVYTTPLGVTSTITLDHGSLILSASATPFISVPATATLQLFMDEGSLLGDSVHPAVTVAGTLSGVVTGTSQVLANALAGAGGAVFEVSDSRIGSPQAIATITSTTFTNSQTWPQLDNATITPAGGPVTDSTNTIQALQSGNFLVNATACGTASATTVDASIELEWSLDGGATWLTNDANNLKALAPLLAGIPNPVIAATPTTFQASGGLTAIVKVPSALGTVNGVKFRLIASTAGGNFTTPHNAAPPATILRWHHRRRALRGSDEHPQ